MTVGGRGRTIHLALVQVCVRQRESYCLRRGIEQKSVVVSMAASQFAYYLPVVNNMIVSKKPNTVHLK